MVCPERLRFLAASMVWRVFLSLFCGLGWFETINRTFWDCFHPKHHVWCQTQNLWNSSFKFPLSTPRCQHSPATKTSWEVDDCSASHSVLFDILCPQRSVLAQDQCFFWPFSDFFSTCFRHFSDVFRLFSNIFPTIFRHVSDNFPKFFRQFSDIFQTCSWFFSDIFLTFFWLFSDFFP